MAGRQQEDTGTFRELTFAEQDQSIAAAISNLQSSIEHHVAHSPRRRDTIDECIAQVDRLKERLLASYRPQDSPASAGATIVEEGREVRPRVLSPRLADPRYAPDFVKEVIEEAVDAGL